MKVICAHCGTEFEKKTGDVNRANKMGLRLFCGRICAGFGRRKNRTIEENKRIKAEYDKEYRVKNRERINERTQDYNSSPAGRAMQKRNREKFKQSHLEYCRTEEYRNQYKKPYDQKYHAKKKYGEFFEAALILDQIETLILPERKEAKIQKGTYNKSQHRKRLWNSLQKT